MARGRWGEGSPVDWQADFGWLRDCYTGNRLRTIVSVAIKPGDIPYRQ